MSYSYPEGYQKNSKIERLAKRLKGCWIHTLDGEVVGQVIDVVANAQGKLELVIPLNITRENRQQLLLLKANLIKQTNINEKLLFVERTPEIDNLLETNLNPSNLKPYSATSSSDSTLPVAVSPLEPNIVENVTIPLKEEKLMVERERRKVGEVVIRKEVETHFVQVPVKREKLVIEQVGEDAQTITEIPLSEEVVRVVKTDTPN